MEATKRSTYQAEELEAVDALEGQQSNGAGDKASKKSLGLERTQSENALKTNMQKLVDIRDGLAEDLEDCTAKFTAVFGELTGGKLAAKQDLEKAIAELKEALEHNQMSGITQLEGALTRAVNRSDLNKISVEAMLVHKRFLVDKQYKDTKSLIARTKRMLAQEDKKGKRQKTAEEAAEDIADEVNEAPKAPFAACLESLAEANTSNINGSTSHHEVKLGVRIGKLAPRTRAGDQVPVEEMMAKNQMYKSLAKACDTHLAQTGQSSVKNRMKDVAKVKKVFKMFKDSYDQSLLTKLILPDEDWAGEIYGFEVFATTGAFSDVMTTMNCTIDARCYVSGNEIAVGIPFSRCPGEDFSQKRAVMLNLTVDALFKLVQETGGWMCNMKSGENALYVIPSGYVVGFSSRGAKCVRWGISGEDQDTLRVLNMAREITKSFPEMANGSQALGQFMGVLQDMV